MALIHSVGHLMPLQVASAVLGDPLLVFTRLLWSLSTHLTYIAPGGVPTVRLRRAFLPRYVNSSSSGLAPCMTGPLYRNGRFKSTLQTNAEMRRGLQHQYLPISIAWVRMLPQLPPIAPFIRNLCTPASICMQLVRSQPALPCYGVRCPPKAIEQTPNCINHDIPHSAWPLVL